MADWVYCGSSTAADAAGTQSLLRAHRAIWCSPPRGVGPWPGTPQPDDKMWLVWSESRSSQIVVILGGGLVERAPRGLFGKHLFWTDRDSPGVRAAAELLGYGGGASMSFLRLRAVVFPIKEAAIQGLTDIDSGLNIATPAQVSVLSAALPMM